MMAIGTLSKRTGVHIETIRYYERAGVLPKAERAANGRRVYGDADAERLAFIRHARDLGFELNSVRALLRLQTQPEMSCVEACELASAQLSAVERRLEHLAALRDQLQRMVSSCENGRVADCCVIEALAAERDCTPCDR
jgi:DNA-binding transcriptional MerR regulator